MRLNKKLVKLLHLPIDKHPYTAKEYVDLQYVGTWMALIFLGVFVPILLTLFAVHQYRSQLPISYYITTCRKLLNTKTDRLYVARNDGTDQAMHCHDLNTNKDYFIPDSLHFSP